MFAPPPVVDTEVFARLPENLRYAERRSAWLDVQMRGAPFGSFLEGPSFDRAGNLYCVDIAYGRIFRVSPEGEFETVAEYDGEPNGLKIHQDGRIFIADHKHGIMLVEPGSGEVRPHCDRPILERFKGVNDLFFAANGDLWFTDQGQTGLHDPSGGVYRLNENEGLRKVLGGIPSPNGLVMNRDETQLFVAVTRDNAIWRLPILLDGTTSKVGRFIQLSGSMGGPDGMALDTEGNLAVAHAGLGVVWVFSPLGEPLLRVQSRTGHMTTNVAFGGSEMRTLYITESDTGSILRAELPNPGKPMFSHG